jgi:hypothetical protein
MYTSSNYVPVANKAIVPDNSSTNEPRSERARIISTLALIATLWIASDLGYYFLLPRLGVAPSYNAGAIAISLYYTFRAGIAVISLHIMRSKETTRTHRQTRTMSASSSPNNDPSIVPAIRAD